MIAMPCRIITSNRVNLKDKGIYMTNVQKLPLCRKGESSLRGKLQRRRNNVRNELEYTM